MNFNKMLASLSRSSMLKGSGSDLLKGGAAASIASALLSKGSGRSIKKSGKSAAKMGALAVVGGMAWKAYKSYSEKQAQDRAFNQGNYAYEGDDLKASPSFDYSPSNMQEERFDEVVEASNSQGQMLLLRAMVAAAHADGHIDSTERMKIFDQVESMDLSTEDKASLFDEMRSPRTIEQITQDVPNAEAASEVYAASAMAIDMNAIDSRVYLNKLAAMLCIPTQLQDELESTIEQSRLSIRV